MYILFCLFAFKMFIVVLVFIAVVYFMCLSLYYEMKMIFFLRLECGLIWLIISQVLKSKIDFNSLIDEKKVWSLNYCTKHNRNILHLFFYSQINISENMPSNQQLNIAICESVTSWHQTLQNIHHTPVHTIHIKNSKLF